LIPNLNLSSSTSLNIQRQFITMNRNQLQKHRIRHNLQILIATVSILFLSSSCAFAFSTQPRQLCPTTTKKSTIGANLPGKQRIPSLLWSQQQPTADFEYQELQIQMDAMQKQGVKPSMLEPSKRDELKGYVEAILSRRLTNLKTVDSTVPLDVRLRSSLPKTKWRMAFTTQPLMAEALPKDATITLTFAGDNKVEYGLDFFQTLALKRLAAKSTYSVLEVRNSSGTKKYCIGNRYRYWTQHMSSLRNNG